MLKQGQSSKSQSASGSDAEAMGQNMRRQMGDIKEAPSAVRPDRRESQYFFRPRRIQRLKGSGHLFALLIPILIGTSILAINMAIYPDILLRILGYALLGGPISSMISSMIIVLLGGSHGPNRLTLAPTLALRDSGIEFVGIFGLKRLVFAWSQVQWMMSPGDILWLKLEEKWLCIRLADYDVGALLPELLRERCTEASLPNDKMEVFTSPTLSSTTRLPLQWIDNTLRTGPGRLDLSKPYEARVDKSGMLNLKQGPTLVEIHPHDPRRPLIEAFPEVAAALSRQKKRRVLR
jgi:hypothetical protein